MTTNLRLRSRLGRARSSDPHARGRALRMGVLGAVVHCLLGGRAFSPVANRGDDPDEQGDRRGADQRPRPSIDRLHSAPYAILYGILVPPGKSVVAQTPQGAVTLKVVPVEPRMHVKGLLVYGVFSALPFELTVFGANGSTVYT